MLKFEELPLDWTVKSVSIAGSVGSGTDLIVPSTVTVYVSTPLSDTTSLSTRA